MLLTNLPPASKEHMCRVRSAPHLPGLVLPRALHRQRLPPLDVAVRSPPSAGLGMCNDPWRVMDEPVIRKRQSRRTKTAVVKVVTLADESLESPPRKPRRCKTSAADNLQSPQDCYGTVTPLSTHSACITCASTPQYSSWESNKSIVRPLASVDGQEGVSWVRGARLGSGSYGTVYKAMDRNSGKMFAVKEIVIGTHAHKENKEKVKLDMELEICRSLRHPNIVSYMGHTFTDEHLYIFLEYVPGGSMKSVVQEFGPLGDTSLRLATMGMVEGLNYLHTQNPPVVHRDIKAANLLVDLEMCVKLADFGCSKCSADTQSFTTVGSVPWMAPEVLLLEGGHGRKADIWSVGCTIIELATAENPWGKNAFDNIMYAMQHIALSNTAPPIPEALCPDGRNLIEQCVSRIAPERPTPGELLDHPFLSES